MNTKDTDELNKAFYEYLGATPDEDEMVDWLEFKEKILVHQEQAIREARNNAIDDVKRAGYGYDDGTGFVLNISYKELAQLKTTPQENTDV